MTARGGSFVVFAFATWWLWVGASGLPMPWRAVAFAVGGALLLAVAWHVLRNLAAVGGSSRFDRRKFWITVAIEIAALNAAAWLLGLFDLLGYLFPAIGSVVALHFIGLWWASRDVRFITLTWTMLAVNVIACFFAPGRAAMLAISGLGSSAALSLAMVRRR
jgi:hypothetical protein